MTRYRKTYAAAIAAICVTISLLWDGLTNASEATALVTAWSGVGAVYFWPNDAPVGEPADPAISERGAGEVVVVLVTVAVCVLLALAFGWDFSNN